jgi:glycosyltransferase involved in cell wall biosynthesis
VFAVPGGKTTLAEEQQPFACEIYGADERNYVRKINAVSQYLLRSDAEYVVSDFGGTFFYGACIAKKSCPGKMKHIVVIHSDADSMYDRYAAMQEYIDKCIVISRKMITELQKRNFSTDKIYYLNWDIKCEEKLGRAYAPKGMPLRIGYAGRLTVHIKRLDLCVEVARELKRRGVPFLFQLAGVGDYSEQMKAEIQKAYLCEEMELLGYIERQDIDTFWQKQDIMISCSEHEGHSISQMEAMAAGAVPIVMDVSGAQDDITDSENGFIVEQGDICEMVNKICSLNEDRMLLQTMGSKAHESIYLKMQESKGNRLWL